MKNVLLVDDDKTFNFISTRLLELTGMAGNILTAWNGKQALDLFERNQGFPDVILLDLNMPVMDGFEFLEAFNTLNLQGKNRSRSSFFPLLSIPKTSSVHRY